MNKTQLIIKSIYFPQIIVATVQIVLDVLNHGHVKLSDFNIIVFDECHHGRNDHPMHQLMQHFEKYSERDHPRVIGLSGMLTSTSVKAQNVKHDLLALEATYRATIATVKGMGKFKNVLLYSTSPKESFIPYEVMTENQIISYIGLMIADINNELKNWPIDSSHERRHNIDRDLNKVANPIKKISKLFNDYIYQINDLGMFTELINRSK